MIRFILATLWAGMPRLFNRASASLLLISHSLKNMRIAFNIKSARLRNSRKSIKPSIIYSLVLGGRAGLDTG
jgi:hypothetical protein